MPYLGMGTDSSDGEITLRNGALDVRWRPRSNRDLYRLMDRTMRDVSEGAGGRYSTSVLCALAAAQDPHGTPARRLPHG